MNLQQGIYFFYGRLPADVLVIPPSADPLQQFGRTVLPLKVFQYLAAGRPIVTGEVPDTAERRGAAARRDASGLTWSARGEALLEFLHEHVGVRA